MAKEQQAVVGILGAGRIGRVHVEALARYRRDVRIKHVADPYLSEEFAHWAEGMGVERTGTDADAVLSDSEVNAVFICSPTPTHSDYIKAACKAGKHIYCEKPLDSDIDRIREAIGAIDASGVKFLMGFMRRFDKSQRRMKELLDSGQVGVPQVIKLCSRDPALPPYGYIETSGGIFFDSMIHDFDLARFFSGSEVEEVYAMGGALIDPHVAQLGDVDTAMTLLKFESGAMGLIDLSRQSNCGYDQRTEVHASQGGLRMENLPESTIVRTGPEGVTGEKPVYFFLERYENAFAHAHETFFRMINEDLSSPVTAFDGLQAVRIAKAAKQSMLEHRPVRLQEIPGL